MNCAYPGIYKCKELARAWLIFKTPDSRNQHILIEIGIPLCIVHAAEFGETLELRGVGCRIEAINYSLGAERKIH